MDNIKLYGVAGYPILQSKSPIIFEQLFDQNKLLCSYNRISTNSIEFLKKIILEFNIQGMNITSPLKLKSTDLVNEIEIDAQKIKSINCIKNSNSELIATNTDFTGSIKQLKNENIVLKNKKCVVLGAGGAARAIIYALLLHGSEIYIINRTSENSYNLSNEFNIKSIKNEDSQEIIKNADFIFNTVNFDLINIQDISNNCIFIDAIYHKSIYQKMKIKNYYNGLYWLYHQAIDSFRFFTENDKNLDFALSNLEKDAYLSTSNIFLIGFPGSGKTTIARELAKKLSFNFIDSDELIESSENMAIPVIFNNNGESYFRKKENELLIKLREIKNSIVSLGGGLINETSFNELSKIGIIFYLFTDFEICINRLNYERPLLQNKSKVEQKELYNDRKIIYYKYSNILIDANLEIEKIIENVIFEYKNLIND